MISKFIQHPMATLISMATDARTGECSFGLANLTNANLPPLPPARINLNATGGFMALLGYGDTTAASTLPGNDTLH